MIKTTFFSSKISKRIFTTFLACALLPIFCFATLAYFQVTNHLKKHTVNSLHGSVKSLALSIDDHLKFLENELEFISYTLRGHNTDRTLILSDSLSSRLSKGFKSITIFKNQNQSHPLLNQLAIKSLTFSDSDIEHMTANY